MSALPESRRPHPVLTLLGRALERVFEQLLALDPDTRARFAAFEGRAVTVDFAGPERRALPAMRLVVEQGRLRVGPAFAATSALEVRATPSSLLAFALAREGAGTPGRVSISGDADLARRLEQLAHAFAPDVDEAFARVFGDIAGVPLARAFRGALAGARSSARALAADAAEFLTEEGRDLVARAELDGFLDDVDRVRERAERLEARFARVAAARRSRA
ncbi:MAG: sterol-binding protein [Lysobacteraceae bacterium]|nr:MAG: sterol-binding protein [Xanthomonadaceae bacterium]